MKLAEALCHNRKVAGSIPDKIIGFFNLPNTSRRAILSGSTHPLPESNRNIPDA
jgi:hypothetical protein